MTDFYALSFKKYVFYSRKVTCKEICQFIKKLFRFHWVTNTEWYEWLRWQYKISLFLIFKKGLKLFKTHLFNQYRFCRCDASTACETVIKSNGSFGLLLAYFHYFRLNTVLSWCNIVINLCKFYNTCEHVDFWFIIIQLFLWLFLKI